MKPQQLNAWFEHYNVALAYRAIPVKLDPGAPEARPLVDMGLSYFYGLTLSYALESDRYAAGVDAKSGDVVYSAETEAAGDFLQRYGGPLGPNPGRGAGRLWRRLDRRNPAAR